MAIDTTKTITKVTYEGIEIPLGGSSGGDSGGQYLVQVIDYDGTVLKSDHLDTGATFELPEAPTNHPKLVFQEWSSPVTITDNTITVGNRDITIGATYKTASGLTEIDIVLTKATGLEVVCNMVGNKNWGDGTTDSATTHTYTDYGSYTITCDGTSIPNGSSSSSGMFGASISNYNYYCVDVRVGELVTSIGTRAFEYCYSLASITIPSGVTSIRNYAFQDCNSLASITIPSGVTNIRDHMFENCNSLASITIPSGVTSIGNNVFEQCYFLKSITIPSGVNIISYSVLRSCYFLTAITIPSGVTSIQNYAFQNCNSLASITIPSGVTSIGSAAFSSCYNVRKYDFTSATNIPTLSSTNVFASINDICKIYVPDALYDDWIVATNWATYADYIYKASEMED